jgi:hypothetical protein
MIFLLFWVVLFASGLEHIFQGLSCRTIRADVVFDPNLEHPAAVFKLYHITQRKLFVHFNEAAAQPLDFQGFGFVAA